MNIATRKAFEEIKDGRSAEVKSNDKKGLIFFNCLSKYSKNSKGEYQFHEWIDRFHLLENIDVKSILFKEYSEFYPKTNFKLEINNYRTPHCKAHQLGRGHGFDFQGCLL